uniref:IS200/IS605 family transposase n=1 Tax=Umezakia ovalisporum TaxID=75695 RepID=UPI0036F3FDB7
MKKHPVSLINYHLVWIPKRRKKILVVDVEKRLRTIIGEVWEEKEWKIIEMEIMPDHVHLPLPMLGLRLLKNILKTKNIMTMPDGLPLKKICPRLHPPTKV